MTLSYIAWIIFTLGAYSLMGGDGGLMDGFGMVIMLCFTALISSVIYTAIWARDNGERLALHDG